MAEYEIVRIVVRQWSSRKTGQQSGGVALAGIYMHGSEKYHGYVQFFADGTELRPPLFRRNEEQILLHMNMSQFQATLEMFRLGMPVKVFYRSSTDAGIIAGQT